MGGNGDKAWEFLFKFSCVVSSAYLWTPRLHASVSDKFHATEAIVMQQNILYVCYIAYIALCFVKS